ncbi:MAG: hypothetical protein NTX76_03050 [Alphaproteobacteria bacterium]|nr:hypothetical protein [Alphaproteobacteria bacterium]
MMKIVFFILVVFFNISHADSCATSASTADTTSLLSSIPDEALGNVKDILAGRIRYNQTLRDLIINNEIPIRERVACYVDVLGLDTDGGIIEKMTIETQERNIENFKCRISYDIGIYQTISSLVENRQHQSQNLVFLKTCREFGFSCEESKINVLYAYIHAEFLKEEAVQKNYLDRNGIKPHQKQAEPQAQRDNAVELFYLQKILGTITPFTERSVVKLCKDYTFARYNDAENKTESYFDYSLLIELGRQKAEKSIEEAGKILVSPVLKGEFDPKARNLMSRIPRSWGIMASVQSWCQCVKVITQNYIDLEDLIEEYKAKQELHTEQNRIKRKKQSVKKEKKAAPVGFDVRSSAQGNVMFDLLGVMDLPANSLSSQAAQAAVSSPGDSKVLQKDISCEDISYDDKRAFVPDSAADRPLQDFGVVGFDKSMIVLPSKALKIIEEQKMDFVGPKEKIRSEVQDFLDSVSRRENVKYEDMVSIIRKMGGRVQQAGRASHRHIEIPHMDFGKTIYGGTYQPHGRQKNTYPFWLTLGVDAINQAINL